MIRKAVSPRNVTHKTGFPMTIADNAKPIKIVARIVALRCLKFNSTNIFDINNYSAETEKIASAETKK